MTPSALLHLRTWLPTDLHEPFSAWCDDHHREQLNVPGIMRARRFEYIDGTVDDPPQFLTMYEVESLDVYESAAYLELRATASVLPEFLTGHLRVVRRDCTIEAAIPAAWWPPLHTDHLEEFHLNDDGLIDDLRSVSASTIEGLDTDVVIRVLTSGSDSTFALFDHGADESGLIDTIAHVTGATRSSWRCVFDESAP